MRNIRFRGVRVLDDSMVEGDLVRYNDCIMIVDNRAGKRYVVYPKTVGQLIHIKDVNGVELWEGDLCKVEGYLGALLIRHITDGDDPSEGTTSNFALFDRNDDICQVCFLDVERVGNIHQNPDLLTQFFEGDGCFD